MSSSTPAIRFLLDENVRAELDSFLKKEGLDVKRLSKGAPDRALATVSRDEHRLIVTNDEDFTFLHQGVVFGVVHLRVPQRDLDGLLAAFGRLLSECKKWEANIIVLGRDRWHSSPLPPKQSGKRQAA